MFGMKGRFDPCKELDGEFLDDLLDLLPKEPFISHTFQYFFIFSIITLVIVALSFLHSNRTFGNL